MTDRKKMICPDCGVELNHHADKIDYHAALNDPEAANPDFDGVVDEAHTCPSCGRGLTRPASDSD